MRNAGSVIVMTTAEYAETFAARKAEAVRQLAAYQQYAGYFEKPDWVLYSTPRRVTTKMGVAFEAGDLVLGCATSLPGDGRQFVKLYSFRNRIDTVIGIGQARLVVRQA